MARINISQILMKRGNTTAANTYVGPLGELVVDTGLRTIRVQDGVTAGGMSTLATNVQLQALGTYANATFGTSSYGNANVGLYLSTSSIISNINANVTAANASITSLTSNAATQATLINAINANVTAANASITSLTSNAAIQASILDTLTGNAASQSTLLDTLTANAATQSISLSTLLSNAITQQTSLTDLVANAAAQAQAIANAAGTYGNATVEAYIGANIGTLYSNAATQAGSISTLQTQVYANANVAAYLPTYTGNIAGNIVKNGYTWTFSNTGTTTFPTGVRLSNARGANTVNFTTDVDKSFQIETQTSTTSRLWSFGTDGNLTLPQFANINFSNGVNILSTVGATYGNTQVVAYLPTYTGNIAGNIVKNGYTWAFGTDGKLTIPASGIITAPDAQEFRLQARAADSVLRNEINLDPNEGTYMSVWSEELSTSFSTGAGSWVTASWVNASGFGAAYFTGAEDLQNFWTTGPGSFVESVEVSINGGARGRAGYEGNNGEQYGVELSVDRIPVSSPTTITSLVFYYRTKNRIDIDYLNGQMLLKAQSMNINLETTNYLNLRSQRANPVRIFTNDTTHKWEFDSTGSLTLPREGKIYGIGQGAASDRYGYISWTGNSSGDGSGFNTMRLVPDQQGLESADQYIILDPTAGSPGHIHIRAGGTQDNSGADLFLGGENSHVKIGAGVNPPVTIAANNHSWAFSNIGTLTLPASSGQIGRSGYPDGIDLYNNNGGTGYVRMNYADQSAVWADSGGAHVQTSGANTWDFGTDANLTLPETGYLRVGTGIVAGFASSPAPFISGFSSVSAENFKFQGNGVNILSAVGANSYGNTQVAAYLLHFDGDIEFTSSTAKIGNVDVITVGDHIRSPAYQFSNGTSIFDGITGGGSTYSNANVVAMLAANTTVFIGNTNNVNTYSLQANNTQVFIGGNAVIASGNAATTNSTSLLHNMYFAANGTRLVRNTGAGVGTLSFDPTGFTVSGLVTVQTANSAPALPHWIKANVNGLFAPSGFTTSTMTASGTVAANGTTGIQTSQTTFPLVNQTATTILFGGAATSISMGSATIGGSGSNVFVGNAIGTSTGNLTVRAFGTYNSVNSLNSAGGYATTTYSNIAVTGGSGTGMIISMSGVASGYLGSATVTNPGTGYRNGETITIPAGNPVGSLGGSFVIGNYNAAYSGTGNGLADYSFGIDGNLTLPGNVTIASVGSIRYANGVNYASTVTGTYSNTNVAAYLTTATITTTGNITAGNVSAVNFVGTIRAQVGSSFAYATDAYGSLFNTGGVPLPADTNSNAIVAGYTIVGNSGAVTLTVTSATFIPGTPNIVQVATTPTASSLAYPVTVYSADYSPAIPVSTITVGNATISGNVIAPNYLFANGVNILSTVTGSYGNTQANALLSSNTVSTISTTGNIKTIANVIGTTFMFANGVNYASTITGTYSNTNVASYLTTATITTTGNITAGNLTSIGTFTVANITTTGTYGNITGANVISANTVSATNYLFANGVNILSNVVTRFESTWTVPTGNSTQSFTVGAGETYYMWVDCNIPNGIIAWNATATITNTNVPVVGAQYAWVYNGGGTPIDFTSIPNQFTGTGNTIVRSSVAPSATTNRFDFGLNNTSGGNVTVRYGWIQIS